MHVRGTQPKADRLHRRATAPLAFIIAIAVLLGACGSDDASVDQITSTSNEGAQSSNAGVETDTTTTAPIPTTAPVEAPTVESGGAIISSTSRQGTDPDLPAEGTTEEVEEVQTVPQGEADTSNDGNGNSRSFAANDTTCPSATFRGSIDHVAGSNECLLQEFAAGRPVVVDYALISTEGDPIYYRYAYDGAQIYITRDARLDQFGSRAIGAQVCQAIEPGRIVPTPLNCSETTSPGFADADS